MLLKLKQLTICTTRFLSSSSGHLTRDIRTINNMIGKHFLTLQEYDSSQIEDLLWSALDMKKVVTDNTTNVSAKKYYLNHVLSGRSISAIFQKKSTRTRISFEAGSHHLGKNKKFFIVKDLA